METDRLIKLIVEKEAMTVPLNDFNKFPSQFFIDAYFNSFLPIDYPEFEEQPEPESLEAYLKIALQCIEMKDYEKALEEAKMGAKRCDEVDDNIFASYLLNVYGTLLFLQGRTELATEILEKSIQRNPTLVNSVAKICNLYLERGDADGALEAFNTAIRKFPKSADLYYHRGQLKFLMNDFKSATQDFQKTIELDPGHVFGHVQCAVAQFKNGIIEPAMKLFEQTKQKFPTSPDVHCYYGELLMEQHKFDQAMENFDKAIQLGSTMAYIDKAMLLHRVFQKSEEASTLLRQVLAYCITKST
ncbi:TOM (translocase of outer membrane) complex component [Coelomomyces lativittatus]|nr:TOM (translocase of outer membrane) complex component [Coelomomyces lativittatus]